MDEGVCEETALRKRAVANEFGLAVCQDGGAAFLFRGLAFTVAAVGYGAMHPLCGALE